MKATLFTLMILFVSCYASDPKTIQKSQPTEISDSIQNFIKPEFETIQTSIRGDTLSIASTSDFLYHPFGKFSDINAFVKKYEWNYKDVLKSEIKSDSRLFRVTSNNSSIMLLLDDEQKSLEIVGGNINDTSILLVNGIRINMSYSSFLNVFFISVPKVISKDIRIIELESGLTGIWHYYSFADNKLKSIVFRSNYVFQN